MTAKTVTAIFRTRAVADAVADEIRSIDTDARIHTKPDGDAPYAADRTYATGTTTTAPTGHAHDPAVDPVAPRDPALDPATPADPLERRDAAAMRHDPARDPAVDSAAAHDGDINDGAWDMVRGLSVTDADRKIYAQAIREGHWVVSADVDERHLSAVTDAMRHPERGGVSADGYHDWNRAA